MPAPVGYTKTPSEVLDFEFDFSRWTALDDDPLASGAVSDVDATGDLTFGTPTVNAAGDKVTCRISGGTDGECYSVRCLGTTGGGQVVQGNLALTVAEPE